MPKIKTKAAFFKMFSDIKNKNKLIKLLNDFSVSSEDAEVQQLNQTINTLQNVTEYVQSYHKGDSPITIDEALHHLEMRLMMKYVETLK